MGVTIEIGDDGEIHVWFSKAARAPAVDRTSSTRSSSRTKCPKCGRMFKNLQGVEHHLSVKHKESS